MNLLKVVLIALGTFSLVIGVTGVFVPGLPTTPFLLLTAGLYIRSSDRLYRLLISNRLIGSYILEFRSNKGMTRRSKIYSIGIMWTMIILSCLFFIPSIYLKTLIVFLGLVGTVVMGWFVPNN